MLTGNMGYMRIVSAILLFLFYLGLNKVEGQNKYPEQPNIIFILADDLGISDLNFFDPLERSFYETPNIDQLAKEGMKFLQAYTNAANCAPTRAALLSGQYYPKQPIYHVGRPELPLEKITDAEMLQRAGYSTAFVGKWHVGSPPEYGPIQQGYQVNIGGSGDGNPNGWDGGYICLREPDLAPPREADQRRQPG